MIPRPRASFNTASLVALAAACGVLALATACAGSPERLVVLNKWGARAQVLDPEPGSILAEIPIREGPHEVIASPDGRRLFVSIYGGEEPDDRIAVIDLSRGRVVASHSVGPYTSPHGLALSRDGSRLWVTCEEPGPSAVLELDARTGRIRKTWETGQQQTHMVAASPDEQWLYATSMKSGTLTAIERDTDRLVVVETGAGAADVGVAPDGREVWVANEMAHTLSIVDARTRRVVATLPTPGRQPVRVVFTPDGRQAWVPLHADDGVAVYDVATRSLLGVIALPPAGRMGPIGLLMGRDGRRAYLAHMGADWVAVIDVPERRLLHTVATGPGPDGLALVRWTEPGSTRSDD